MQVIITQTYADSVLKRTVRTGEEIDVTEARAKRLIDRGVAETPAPKRAKAEKPE